MNNANLENGAMDTWKKWKMENGNNGTWNHENGICKKVETLKHEKLKEKKTGNMETWRHDKTWKIEKCENMKK